jgi:hypothetical protein
MHAYGAQAPVELRAAPRALGITPTPANAAAQSVTIGALCTALAEDGGLQWASRVPPTCDEERL